jgi:poly(3-hydroxybutyrate) depolymerase
MNRVTLFSAAALLAGTSFAAFAQTPIERRYLNEVFDAHERTGDLVFAERHNDSSGKAEKLTLRLFQPKGDTESKRPLIVITPGGAFSQHEDHWMDDFGEQLARAGYVVAIHRYRLSKNIDTADAFRRALAKAVLDQKEVVQFFLRDAQAEKRFRIDPDKIFIGGHSAGAITSLYAGYLSDPSEISAELTEALAQQNAGQNAKPMDYRLRGVINMSGLVADLALFDKGEPPLISIHGDLDDVVRIGTAPGVFGSLPIHERAQAIGLSSEMYPIEGAGHNDTANSQLCPECVPLIRRFLFSALREDSRT